MAELQERKVLVTGGNGYIGSAVARAFTRSLWTTYGLVRRQASMPALAAQEVLPVLGAPADISFVDEHPELHDLDVVISVTEQIMDYEPHFNEILAMLRRLASLASQNGKRLLVLFTSGCKDFGETALSGDPNLKAHTEDAPLNAPAFAKDRAHFSAQIFEHGRKDGYDAVLLRPTPVHGLTASLYAPIFELAEQAKFQQQALVLNADPKTIIHNLHVDDCGDAYRALAEHPDRAAVAGQAFNISGRHAETLSELGDALVREYGLGKGVTYNPAAREAGDFAIRYGYGYSQAVDSGKLRRLTGWTDQRPLLAEGLRRYKVAYEAARDLGHESLVKTKAKLAGRESLGSI